MRRQLFCIFIALFFSACASKPDKTVQTTTEPFEHNPAVSAESILVSRAASQQYQHCLSEQIKKYVQIEMDVRQSTGEILKACDVEFNPIREAFKKDNVPTDVTRRYLNVKRSRSTPNILKLLMFAQSKRNDKKTATADAQPAVSEKAVD